MTEENQNFTLRKAGLSDFDHIYDIFTRVLADGTTYSYTQEEMTPDRSLAYWVSAPGTHCMVADVGGEVAGMAAIRPNRTGRGDHVANASFIVDEKFRGRGIARSFGVKALGLAKKIGYNSIQYNYVVSTNEVAVRLWKSLGFEIIGTLPKGHQHAQLGLVDVFVMHRFLDDIQPANI